MGQALQQSKGIFNAVVHMYRREVGHEPPNADDFWIDYNSLEIREPRLGTRSRV